MDNKKKTLLLFTSSYPFGDGEEFLETEIQFLSREFKEVHIFPIGKDGAVKKLPANAKIISVPLYQPYSTAKMIVRNIFFALFLYAREISLTKNKKKYLTGFRKHFRYLLHRINDAERLGKTLRHYRKEETVVYSFWFNIWVAILILARRVGGISAHILTRAHGGDFDLAQKKTAHIPFRSLELKCAHKIIAVSNYGKNYFLKNYPFAEKKIFTSHLGVSNRGDNPFHSNASRHFVSCSYMLPVKRLHLIPEILKNISLKITWTHIGDGEMMQEIKKLCRNLPENITVNFTGHIPNEQVIRFYQSTPVDLFINVSKLEGIPFSIMEAISFGIPAVGCNTCGVPEIVTKESGFLLEKYFSPEVAAKIISGYLLLDKNKQVDFRKKVKQFWKTHFNADVNYPEFIKEHLS